MTYKEQVKQIASTDRLNKAFGGLNKTAKKLTNSLKSASECLIFISGNEVYCSPYDEPEKRVIGGKIVNVTYHKINWAKNFAARGV